MCEFQALKVKEAYKDNLLDRPNVMGTGVGLKEVNGNIEDAIIVFVEEKLEKETVISKYSASSIIPESLDGIPTKVIEVGQIVKQGYQNRVRPIQPGFSTGHGSITAGTIGGFFRDKDNDIVALSNNHVFAWENKAKYGDPIYQPGPMDSPASDIMFKEWPQPTASLPYFATLKKFLGLNRSNNLHDSAIAKVHQTYIEGNLINYNYPEVNRPMAGISQAALNMNVQKFGRTTGKTHGKVIALHGSFTISYDFGPARFNDCIVLSGMSTGGDSGSLIFDDNMNAIGLLFAGSGKVTLANPIQYVITEYGLNVIDQNLKVQNVAQKSGWVLHSINGMINATEDTMQISANSNTSCYVEKPVSHLNSVSMVINSQSDQDDEYGPGIALSFPSGEIFKVALGGNGASGRTNAHVAIKSKIKTVPNTEYVLRIKLKDNTWVGSIYYNNEWTEVISMVYAEDPVVMRVGKMNEQASSGMGRQGLNVKSYFSDPKIN
jgi:hypothetical protein